MTTTENPESKVPCIGINFAHYDRAFLRAALATMRSFFSKVDSERIFLAFLSALVGLDFAYRVQMACAIYSKTSKIRLIAPEGIAPSDFLKAPIIDLIFIGLLAFGYLLVKFQLRKSMPRLTQSAGFFAGEMVASLGMLMLTALIMRVQFELLTQLGVGLTVRLMESASHMMSADGFVRMARMSDALFLAVAPVIFFIGLACARAVRQIYKPLAVCLCIVILALQLLPTRTPPAWPITNPVVHLAETALHSEIMTCLGGNEYERRTDLPGPAQMNSIALIDPAFAGTNNSMVWPPAEAGLAPDGHRWNILIFILESVGSDYIFDNSGGKPTPMPFLKQICSQGLYLSNHFATANMSTRAGFSIFTGLYPPPDPDQTCIESHWDVPTFNHYLQPDYDYFLIQPDLPTYCFPEALLLNNGLREVDSMANIPPGPFPDKTLEARNERHCFDFLQSRLDRASEPFLGVYWSFLAHWPYSDYGPDYRIRPNLNSDRDRYYNNLRVLDTQFHRIWDHLEKDGVAAHTLFVVVGDHGEGFDQHPGVWGHGFTGYDETYRVPMVFWQPNLIKPQIVKFPTSHVDIVPTLLDLLGLQYDPSRFQGYSVLRGPPDRKYIFTMSGFVDCISAITPGMKKVTLSLVDNNSTAFDLAVDPDELHPISRFQFPDQIEAILKFRNYQLKMLSEYDLARLSHRQYPVPAPETKLALQHN